MELEHSHTREAIRERLSGERAPSYVRDWVYGGIDGCVTTFAIVAGAVGADLSARVVLIMGFANLLADGLSMAASNFSGTRTEQEEAERLLAIERKHIALAPEGEREEIRQIFGAKGFSGADLERIVEVVTANEAAWASTMLVEEYGVAPAQRSALKAATSTFTAFVLCGLFPLLPYLLGTPDAARLSVAAAGVTFFAIGSIRSRWSLKPWWRSGLETFAIGLGAALVAYAVGAALQAMI